MKKNNGIINFNFSVPLKKGVEILKKEVNGVVEYYLVGEATNSEVDRDDEFLAKDFLSKAAPQMIGITSFFEHEGKLDKSVGVVTNASYNPGGGIDVEVFLESPEKNELVKRIIEKHDHGIKIGFSIGGRIFKSRIVKSENGRQIRELMDGEIYELSVVGIPSNYTTFATAVTKAFDINGSEVINSESDAGSEEMDKSVTSDIDNYEESVAFSALWSELSSAYWIFTDILWYVVYSYELSIEDKLSLSNELFDKFLMLLETITNEIEESEKLIDP